MKLFKKSSDSLKNRHQNHLESMKFSKLFFDYVHLLYYKCHKINPDCNASFIDSPDMIKNEKIVKDNVTIALNT